MSFEKNPFPTAVSIPESFHVTPLLPTLEIHQPTLIDHVDIFQDNFLIVGKIRSILN